MKKQSNNFQCLAYDTPETVIKISDYNKVAALIW